MVASDESNRLEQILEEDRPFYKTALYGFFTIFFFIYDAIIFLPFKIFADPEKKKALSQRDKAKPTKAGDPASPWRHVDTIGKPLRSRVFDDCCDLGSLWDHSVK